MLPRGRFIPREPDRRHVGRFFSHVPSQVFFAEDLAPADLMKLADAVAEPLYRELAGV
jgi:hypothetical protein